MSRPGARSRGKGGLVLPAPEAPLEFTTLLLGPPEEIHAEEETDDRVAHHPARSRAANCGALRCHRFPSCSQLIGVR